VSSLNDELPNSCPEADRKRKGTSGRLLSDKLEEWRAALLKSHQVSGFVVGSALRPTAVEDADPFESEGTKRGLVLHAPFTAALVESLGPEGAWDRLAHPFDEGLAQKRRTTLAPMDPRLVSAAFGDGCDTRVLLERCGIGEAFAALTEGHEQARGQRRASTG